MPTTNTPLTRRRRQARIVSPPAQPRLSQRPLFDDEGSLDARFRAYDEKHPDVPTAEYQLMQGVREYGPMHTPHPIKQVPSLRPSHIRRFWARVQKTDGCWQWTGSTTLAGYGHIEIRTARVYVHRVSYVLHKGEIPSGFVIDHLCGNRGCVNPDHLEAVPQAVNSFRGHGAVGKNVAKTHCIHGHPITEPGQYILDQGSRRCLICKREKERRGREHRRAMKAG